VKRRTAAWALEYRLPKVLGNNVTDSITKTCLANNEPIEDHEDGDHHDHPEEPETNNGDDTEESDANVRENAKTAPLVSDTLRIVDNKPCDANKDYTTEKSDEVCVHRKFSRLTGIRQTCINQPAPHSNLPKSANRAQPNEIGWSA
jgi:cobalamin biosynthesis protein CobT